MVSTTAKPSDCHWDPTINWFTNGRCGHTGDVFCILALWSGKGGRLNVDFIDADGGVRHWNEGHVHKDEGSVVILVDEHLHSR